MSIPIPRRDFLKAAPAAGALSYAVATQGCAPGEPEAGGEAREAEGGSPRGPSRLTRPFRTTPFAQNLTRK